MKQQVAVLMLTIPSDEGRGPLTPPQPTLGHGANATFDEEDPMTDQPVRLVLGRPPVDGSEADLEAWADAFLDAILGPEEPEPAD